MIVSKIDQTEAQLEEFIDELSDEALDRRDGPRITTMWTLSK